MIQDALQASGLIAPALGALVFFVTFFLGTLVWVFRRGSAQVYRELELKPFDEADIRREVSRVA